ncbi:MAG: CcdB family protein [Myxococcota bacterium]
MDPEDLLRNRQGLVGKEEGKPFQSAAQLNNFAKGWDAVARGRTFKRVTRIMPVVEVRGQDHVVLMPELAGIDRGLLKKRVDSLAMRRDDLVAALDFLFTGV